MSFEGGYAGAILHVDLDREEAGTRPLPEAWVGPLRGGAAINAALAWEALPPGGDPYAPDNRVIFGLGPLVGTATPGAGKGNVTTRSPVQPFLGISGHGRFGMLKFAGYDHLVITGRARRPTLLRIEDDRVEFLPADDLWGRDVFDATDRVWAALGERFDVTCIGPAGENRVRDASLITNKYAAFARTGVGAVLGSKNLKGIAVFGSGGVAVADRQRFLRARRAIREQLLADRNLLEWRRFGTLISLEVFARLGLYAKKNFQEAYHEELLERFSPEGFLSRIKEGDVACQACPVGCKHHVAVRPEDGPPVRMAVSCMNAVMQSFGTFCAVESWEEVVRCAEVAARMGLDFMSTGGLIAFAMELREKGLLPDGAGGGPDIRWGNGEAVRRLIRQIAHREGLGDVLAQGLDEAARTFGAEAGPLAMHSKGLAVLYDPRVRLGSTEIFSQFTNVRGYLSNVSVAMVERTPEQIRKYCRRIGLPPEAVERIVGEDGYNVGRLNKWTEDVTSALEILGVCLFPPFQRLPLELWAEACSATTGIETTPDDLVRAAENLWHLRRAWNLREGAGPEHDTCPERFFREGVAAGPRAFEPLDPAAFRALVEDYYDERGWDRTTGRPPKAVLEQLFG
ncbi:MAG: aldehyde ferredoxin oxidoreductase [Deferrisomatales bacterium]